MIADGDDAGEDDLQEVNEGDTDNKVEKWTLSSKSLL